MSVDLQQISEEFILQMLLAMSVCDQLFNLDSSVNI